MRNIKKMKKKAKKKEKKINLNKIEKKGNISRKKRMKNEIIVVFLIAVLLIRKSFNYSV